VAREERIAGKSQKVFGSMQREHSGPHGRAEKSAALPRPTRFDDR